MASTAVRSAQIKDGDVQTADLADAAVTLAKMANLAQNTIIGRITSSAGVPEALSSANVKTILSLAQADISGLTTASSPTFTNVTLSGRTATRVAYFGVGGAFTDSANFTFSGTDLYVSGAIGIGTAPTTGLLHLNKAAAGDMIYFSDGTTAGTFTTYASKAIGLRANTAATSVLLFNKDTTGGFIVEERTASNALNTNEIGAVLPTGWTYAVQHGTTPGTNVRLSVDSSGNVGIPTGNLNVGTYVTNIAPLTVSGSGYFRNTTNGAVQISVVNLNAGNAAQAVISCSSATSSGFLAALPSNFAAIPILQDYFAFGANSDAAGFAFYAGTAGQNVKFIIGGATETARMTSAGMSIGSAADPSAKLHVLSTTEQLRLGYDVSNYATFTVDSTSKLFVSSAYSDFTAYRNGMYIKATAADSDCFLSVANDAQQWSFYVAGSDGDNFYIRNNTASNSPIIITPTGNITFGTSATSLFSVIGKTTLTTASSEQLVLKYDNTNYAQFLIDNSPALTINTVVNSSYIYLKTKNSAGTAQTFTFDPNGIFVCPNSFRAYSAGSDSVGSGSNVYLATAGNDRVGAIQLSAAYNMDFWSYNGTAWTKPFTVYHDGYVSAVTGYKCNGTAPVADGTYTVGYKLTAGGVNGTITTKGGIITAVTQAT